MSDRSKVKWKRETCKRCKDTALPALANGRCLACEVTMLRYELRQLKKRYENHTHGRTSP